MKASMPRRRAAVCAFALLFAAMPARASFGVDTAAPTINWDD
jgi:hypothetical protein